MMFSDEPPTGASSLRRPKHQYVMMFHAGDTGIAKRVEFRAHDLDRAVELALADQARRPVDIMEDGDFLCSISQDETSEVQEEP